MQPIFTETQKTARTLAETYFSVRAAYFDRTGHYCWKNVAHLATHGLMGLTIPQTFGGQGACLFEATLIAEELARHCALSAQIFIKGNMGAIAAIMRYGSDEQKRLCASLVLAGDIPAFCFDKEAGGHALSPTTATRKGEHYLLNGTQHGVSGGGISQIHLIIAQVEDENGKHEGLGAFLHIRPLKAVAGQSGLMISTHEKTQGLRGMPTVTLHYDNVEIAATMRILPPKGHFDDLLAICDASAIGNGTIAMGVAASALEEAKDYVARRFPSARPTTERQSLQTMITNLDMALYATRLMIHDASKSAGAFGHNAPDQTLTMRARLFAFETALKTVNQVLQLFGTDRYGIGETMERLYRDVSMLALGPEAASMLRNQTAGNVTSCKAPSHRRDATHSLAQIPFKEAAE